MQRLYKKELCRNKKVLCGDFENDEGCGRNVAVVRDGDEVQGGGEGRRERG